MKYRRLIWMMVGMMAFAGGARSEEAGLKDGKVRVTIEGDLGVKEGTKAAVIFSLGVEQKVQIERSKVTHDILATVNVLQGTPTELELAVAGDGTIIQITGEQLQDWSLRQQPDGDRKLVLRLKKTDAPPKEFLVNVLVEQELRSAPAKFSLLSLAPPQATLLSGFVVIEPVPELNVQPGEFRGLSPLETQYLPEDLRLGLKVGCPGTLAFQLHGGLYTLPLTVGVADPESRQVTLRDFKLVGTMGEQTATFVLTGTARVLNPRGGSLTLLSGEAALTELPQGADWRITAGERGYMLQFDKAGEYPLQFKLSAKVQRRWAWNRVDFAVAPSALQPVVLQGLAAETQFDFTGASRPERTGEVFTTFLPPDGRVQLGWKNAAPESEGKLFFSTEMLTQISVSPGLMRQLALLNGKIMQGELDRVTLMLKGEGEVTRVAGDQVLSWKVEAGASAGERRLVVQFNQPQKNQFTLQVQMQTPIGAFPQTMTALQLRPEGATRFSGHFRIVNEGAVRLEVAEARGLSQISPEQFPETNATKAVLRAEGAQRFAYRFSGGDFALRIAADQILPELTVSQVLAYNLGENEQTIDAEFEVDVREAPLRELLLRVPRGYAVARLNVAGLSDYFLRDLPDAPTEAELRLVYAQPVSGRQVVQLRLEQNQPLAGVNWVLPRLEVSKAKSTRGHVAAAADAGFRLTAEKTVGLTEIATAFFPRKVPGIQSAFRLSESNWEATLRMERLPQSIQADALHLFSIGEGVAYGSSVLNYVISGAPISALKVELSDEYFNVEFTGKDIRSWQKAEGGYVVQLQTPMAGAYTLLATYERPFKPQGETLTFTGARPLDAQSEQGHTLIISAYQFTVKPSNVSEGLLPLETAEVPPEYRLFFDAPILAAYRYHARPFNLQLALSPLVQGDSLNQVADRAAIKTRVSKEGTALTDAQYFVKSRGNAHFSVTLPQGTELWAATVNGATVVPVKDGGANLIPLPQQADPNAVLAIQLKLATRSKDATELTLSTPIVGAPVLLAEWKLEPDAQQRLVYKGGTLTPQEGVEDRSGFAGVLRMFQEDEAVTNIMLIAVIVVMLALSIGMWHLGTRPSVEKFGLRYWAALIIGGAGMLVAGIEFAYLMQAAADHQVEPSRELTLLAPVQAAGQALTVEIGNVPEETSVASGVAKAWPALLAVIAFGMGWLKAQRRWLVVGWTLLAWAALRLPNGAPALIGLLALAVFWHLTVAGLRRFWYLPRRASAPPMPPPGPATAAATAIVLLLGLAMAGTASAQTPTADSPAPLMPKTAPVAETITQTIRVEEQVAMATAKVRWQAIQGQQLPVLAEPAILTKAVYAEKALKLVTTSVGGKRRLTLLALESGPQEIELHYQVAVIKSDADQGITLASLPGLVHEAQITLVNLDVDVTVPAAVAIERKSSGKDTTARLVLAPAKDIRISWRPRSRDLAREKAVFHAELTQLFTPTPGAIDGLQVASIRPAQGELSELVFNVPKGATVTDVFDAAPPAKAADGQANPALVQQWRFDPDTGKLRVNLSPAQSRPFAVVIRSQVATGPLPVTQKLGLIAAENAATQIGTVGVATGNEVQLETVESAALTPINLEDFPAEAAARLANQIPGLTVRRAFRYADAASTLEIKAAAVEPDVRVESQDTLSLGEDRSLLAVNANVEITRAGVFRLSFALPAGMDVESISGPALSHWTEAKAEAARIITLHLRGRTEGTQQFAINLTGPGVKATKGWTAPQVLIREASKQRGTYLAVPEQGMRLQVVTRDGISQLDPQKSGIKQKGVLAFRVLQTPWKLTLDLEQVDAWVQVNSLQHATVSDAQVKVVTNLQYQIENTGLKSFRVALPADADGVKFQGDQVADFLKATGEAATGAGEGVQMWEVKLHRRAIGQYLLQATYQTPVAANAAEVSLRGVQAADVNLQRGFFTVQTSGRLQVRVAAAPGSLQPTEWQSIPKILQKDLTTSTASFAYRLVEPAFVLPMKLERHEATKLLAARVNRVRLTSVVSDNGAMLTQVELEMVPGDKRLLHFTLPKDAKFWFAFVNRSGVWPWRDGDQILVPLEQQSRGDVPVPVKIFYSTQAGEGGTRSLDLNLQAPKFDLPLENIGWNVYLDEKWELKKWTGSLQKHDDRLVGRQVIIDVQGYLQSEATQQREKTRSAEQMLAAGNNALQQGKPQEARRAFESAYGLSQHDNAFNEDARVQLHNLKLQQAVVGLNVRNNSFAGNADPLAGKLRGTSAGDKDANYTQQDAKDQMGRNTADDNAAFTRLAERIIQQQDAAVSNPAAIQATIPEQGRVLKFTRSVVADTWADLQIGIEAKAAREAGWLARVLMLGVVAGIAAGLVWGRGQKSEVRGQ